MRKGKPQVLYTIGYGGWKPNEFATTIRDMKPCGGMLVDIRFNPYSKTFVWTSEGLKNLVGKDNYFHLKALGNKSYGTGKITLVDPPAAYSPLMSIIFSGKSIILMCGCRYPNGCHRTVAAEHVMHMLEKQFSQIIHIYPGEKYIPHRPKPAQTATKSSAYALALAKKKKKNMTKHRNFQEKRNDVMKRSTREVQHQDKNTKLLSQQRKNDTISLNNFVNDQSCNTFDKLNYSG